MTGRTYGSAVPAVKEFRCLRRLPVAITQVLRPSLYVLPFQLAWARTAGCHGPATELLYRCLAGATA